MWFRLRPLNGLLCFVLWQTVLLAPAEVRSGESISLPYPETRRQAIVEEIFGEQVADPYRWLEDAEAQEVIVWSAAQNHLARGYLDGLPGRQALSSRLRELLALPWVGTPYVRGGRQFYHRRLADLDKDILFWRDKAGGPERPLIDPNRLSTPEKNISLGRYSITHDGKTIAYQLRENNADESLLYVKDVASGEVSAIDLLTETRNSRIKWVKDGSGFYYTRRPTDPAIPETERPGHAEIRFHRLGTPQSEDAVVFGPTGDPKTFLSPHVSWNGRWLFVYIWYGWVGSEVYVKDLADPDGDLTLFYKNRDAQIWVFQAGDYFYIHGNENAPNKKLERVPVGVFDRAAWETVIPEPKDAVLDEVFNAGGRLLVRLLRNAANELQIRDLDGVLLHEIDLPAIGRTNWLKGNPDEKEAYYTFSSFAHPWQAMELSMASGRSRLWSEADAPVDPTPYLTEQIWFTSKDGTRVPMFVIRRRDMPFDGSNPFQLYGYGGFGTPIRPGFWPAYFPWMEAGGGLAVANLRGGGEFGKAWHRAAMRRNRQNAFDDFIAAAETLIQRGYTKPERLAIRGRSNGGLLVSAVMTQRPDLFGAVLCGVPLADMVRFTKTGLGKTWIEEYGSPDIAEDFAALYAYSPYHRVDPNQAYPPVLVQTADTDDRVKPLHARKLAAVLQAANQSRNLTLLSVQSQAGHGGGDRIESDVLRWTDEFSFLMQVFGMIPPGAIP